MQRIGAQAELEQAVAALGRDLPRLKTAEACARIVHVRRQAARQGFAPAAALAAGMADAIGRDGRGAPIAAWFDALALAAGCGAGDADTAPLLLATVGVRLAG